ncbi:NmrA family transcriptional regulator [Ktedonosporobacter rubrisoli]|uniref:NmrA family transcriptional regulator n=1 Tax=Ktedonosporobacter rubrisoli TaxID=2509675 RepID=A0A4P6JLN6_KTERU|nr:NAD(P)H-binding protein [Ktedonosporobacter rubrisoli]QBD75576.1 NmrA family transcriptional regulator [Ktedonosporobacter rubrisoli]
MSNIENISNIKQILVLGSTGKTGRRVAQRLQARGIPTRLGSRSGQTPFDWENQATWEPVLKNVEAVYVTFYPDLAAPGASEAISAFVKLAASNGVRRLVLLSGRGEEEAQACEQVVQSSGCEWTIIRASWFNQNFNEGAMLDAVLSGEVALPVGDVGEPFIDVEDIADIAVAALTEERHANQLYEVTGPRLLTFADAVREIAEATGQEIRYVPVTIDQYSAMMSEYGVPEEVISQLVYLFTEVLDGRNAHLSDGVQRALGRQPRDFADFAREAASSGAWSAR